MPTTRYAVLAIMLAATAAQPALAGTCNFTVNGRLMLDDEPCTANNRGGVLRIEAGNAGTIVIRRSILSAGIADDTFPLRHNAKRNELKSFGLVVKSDGNDDKVCYFHQKATLCMER